MSFPPFFLSLSHINDAPEESYRYHLPAMIYELRYFRIHVDLFSFFRLKIATIYSRYVTVHNLNRKQAGKIANVIDEKKRLNTNLS